MKIKIEITYYYKHNYILSTAKRRLKKLYGRGQAECDKMALTRSVDKKTYRGCLYAHTPAWKASVLSRVSASPLVVASHFHSELPRDSDADVGKVSPSRGASVALPRAHPEWSSRSSKVGRRPTQLPSPAIALMMYFLRSCRWCKETALTFIYVDSVRAV